MSGARLAVKVVVSLSLLRDLHPLHSHQFAWRTRISPPTGTDPLPLEFYNADVIAEGLGDANSPELQARARALVDGQIEERMRLGETFGFESTWSGRSRPQVVRDAGERGYETRGIFLGTAHAALNIARVRRRVLEGGHRVPEREIVRRWSAAFENLLAMWNVFDRVHVLDSSADTVRLVAWEGGAAHARAGKRDTGLGGAARVETRVLNRNG